MGKPNPLAQLKDVHLPDSIGWWPLAPGWYLLMFVILTLVLIAALWIHKKRLYAKPKNQAIALLNTYKMEYEKEQNSQLTSSRISELLRRVALVYFPRAEVASLHGTDWLNFLNQTAKDVDFNAVQSMLLDSPFKTSETINLNPLIHNAEQWIKQRKIPCLS